MFLGKPSQQFDPYTPQLLHPCFSFTSVSNQAEAGVHHTVHLLILSARSTCSTCDLRAQLQVAVCDEAEDELITTKTNQHKDVLVFVRSRNLTTE